MGNQTKFINLLTSVFEAWDVHHEWDGSDLDWLEELEDKVKAVRLTLETQSGEDGCTAERYQKIVSDLVGFGLAWLEYLHTRIQER